jgi:DNA-binding transcriptional LysR family regulator
MHNLLIFNALSAYTNEHMELRSLRHFMAVVAHGSFSRAAEAVHLTQPALSRSIQALEAQAGAPLLLRQRGAIEPTDLGLTVLRYARQMDLAERDLQRDLSLVRQADMGELRIGVGPFGGAALIGPVCGRLSQLHPGLRLRIVVGPWKELPQRARDRDVDLIVGEVSEVARLEDFTTHALSQHRTLTVCRRGHPLTLARRSRRLAPDAGSYPQAGPALPQSVQQALIAALPEAQRAQAQAQGVLHIECDASAVLKDILLHSDAISRMPRFMVDAELKSGQLVALPETAPRITVCFGAAWLTQRTLSSAASRFVALLAEHDKALTQLR